jgi:hypothetical protein
LERAKPATGPSWQGFASNILQSAERSSGTGEMGMFFAAEPQKTYPSRSWRGCAALIVAAKGDLAVALHEHHIHAML